MLNDLDVEAADRHVIEKSLRAVVRFIDPQPPARPVLALTKQQIEEFTPILTEAYRCLWSEHPGKEQWQIAQEKV